MIYGSVDTWQSADFGVDILGTWAEADLDGYFADKNYSYMPGATTTDVFWNLTGDQTVSQFESAFSGATHYLNTSAGDPPCFVGSSGSDQFKVNSNHIVEGSTTISNGGIGGNHPYLSGVTIPDYIGAVDPDSSVWVSGVLDSVTSISWLTNITATPDWGAEYTQEEQSQAFQKKTDVSSVTEDSN